MKSSKLISTKDIKDSIASIPFQFDKKKLETTSMKSVTKLEEGTAVSSTKESTLRLSNKLQSKLSV